MLSSTINHLEFFFSERIHHLNNITTWLLLMPLVFYNLWHKVIAAPAGALAQLCYCKTSVKIIPEIKILEVLLFLEDFFKIICILLQNFATCHRHDTGDNNLMSFSDVKHTSEVTILVKWCIMNFSSNHWYLLCEEQAKMT